MREDEGCAREPDATCRARVIQSGPVGGEDGHGMFVERKAANRTPCLRALMFDRSVGTFGNRPGDGERAGIKVKIGPSQRQQLTSPCSRHGR